MPAARVRMNVTESRLQPLLEDPKDCRFRVVSASNRSPGLRRARQPHTPVCGTHFGVCLGQGRRQVCGDAAPPLPLRPCSVWLSNTSCCCSLLGLQFGLFSASTRGAATRIASTRLRHGCDTAAAAERVGEARAQLSSVS